MGRGEEREEGVMATDFFCSYTDELHATRRRQILSQYPQAKDPFGLDSWNIFFYIYIFAINVAVIVMLQLWTATLLRHAGWLKMLPITIPITNFTAFRNNCCCGVFWSQDIRTLLDYKYDRPTRKFLGNSLGVFLWFGLTFFPCWQTVERPPALYKYDRQTRKVF